MKLALIVIVLAFSYSDIHSQSNFRHNFTSSEFTPIDDDYCYRGGGYLKISDVSQDSFYLDIFVENIKTFEGAIEGRVYIQTKNVAEIVLDEGDEYEARFQLFLSPNSEFIFVKCEGGCTIWSGMGICMDGYYKFIKK